MTVSDFVRASKASWQVAPPPATEASIQAMTAAAGVRLPPEYIEFFRNANGGEGDLAAKPGWFQIWAVEEVLDLNQGYSLHEFVPGFFGFGSSGGDELLALDTRAGTPWPVVRIPFIPLEASDAVTVAPDFESFVKLMGSPCDEQQG